MTVPTCYALSSQIRILNDYAFFASTVKAKLNECAWSYVVFPSLIFVFLTYVSPS